MTRFITYDDWNQIYEWGALGNATAGNFYGDESGRDSSGAGTPLMGGTTNFHIVEPSFDSGRTKPRGALYHTILPRVKILAVVFWL
jgi:hypothetical protein